MAVVVWILGRRNLDFRVLVVLIAGPHGTMACSPVKSKN